MNRVLLLLSLVLTACEPVIQKEYISVELSHEPWPVLPRIKASEIPECESLDEFVQYLKEFPQVPFTGCLSKDLFQRFFDRERLLIEHGRKSDAVIDSTKKLPTEVNHGN